MHACPQSLNLKYNINFNNKMFLKLGWISINLLYILKYSFIAVSTLFWLEVSLPLFVEAGFVLPLFEEGW